MGDILLHTFDEHRMTSPFVDAMVCVVVVACNEGFRSKLPPKSPSDIRAVLERAGITTSVGIVDAVMREKFTGNSESWQLHWNNALSLFTNSEDEEMTDRNAHPLPDLPLQLLYLVCRLTDCTSPVNAMRLAACIQCQDSSISTQESKLKAEATVHFFSLANISTIVAVINRSLEEQEDLL
ncbi:unnamed protein product, partial [Mesorhabditis spiculigera]